MIVLIIEILLKFIGFGIKFGKNKSALEKVFLLLNLVGNVEPFLTSYNV